MTQRQKLSLGCGLTLFILAGILTGLYFAFRYTYVAEAREALINPDTSDPIAYGETLFQTRGCAGCHTFDPAGSAGDTGPNLTGIGVRHDAQYIRTSIVNPSAYVAPACPEGPCEDGEMPTFGDILTDTQIDALVAYLMAE